MHKQISHSKNNIMHHKTNFSKNIMCHIKRFLKKYHA